jgi:hypothetical protein
VIAVIVAGIALALDLRFHGLAWRVMYSVTGEESPVGQISGFVYYLGNLTRRQPVTNIDSTFKRFDGNPLGVNTFLEQEVEESKRERQVQMIADAGFGWIRQQFPWQDIEIMGRGNFIDDRNGPPIDAWKKYDHIVELAEKYKLQLIVRLGVPPTWSQPANALPTYTPPVDLEDFVDYAKAVATRYKGRIAYYQVWNEPNVYPEWGDQSVDPEAYTNLLCRTYHALKAIDPSIQVMSATLAQTVALSGRDLSDFVFLQRMYNAGAGKCFDILGAQGYGLFSGPMDRRMRVTTINYSHVIWLRDLMVANGDVAKQIWIGEMAWNPVPDEKTVPDIQGRLNYGQVTDEQAARYAVEGYARAREEWPWVGVINYWYFKNADEREKNQSQYYFRMVDPDFTPRPVYEILRGYDPVLGRTTCQKFLRNRLGTCLDR